jgi:multisubunit Na+/H+ antiporter MnhF subunit
MMQDQRIVVAILAFIAGVIVAFVMFPRPEVETVYKFETKVESDTIYTRTVDTVYVPKMWIKSQILRDTILLDYKPKISLFKTSIPSEYGSTHVSGEVLGEVLKMTATNDFKIPVVTNTITNTETKTIIQKPKGIYLGASINSLLDPGAKVSYLDNKYLFEYQYQPVTKVHSLGISKKLF